MHALTFILCLMHADIKQDCYSFGALLMSFFLDLTFTDNAIQSKWLSRDFE